MVATLAAVSGCANSKLPQLSDVEREVKAFPLLRSAPWHSAPASAPAPSVMAPFAIALGPDGNLWFTEFHAAQIGRITPLGEIATFELGGGLPLRLTAGPYKAIWFTDPGGNRVGRLGMDGVTAYVPLPTPESGPAAIVRGSDGNIWFTEHAANRVARVTPLGTLTEFVLPHRGAPAGIAEGVDGKLYIAESSGNRIDQMSMDGRFREFRLPRLAVGQTV
jgi:virginiamycin B lyase